MPLFALFDFAPDRATAFFQYALSILGGGVAGFVAAIFLGKLADRALLGKGNKSPAVMHSLFRWLTALSVAILIAILLFPGGGGGKGAGEGKEEGPKAPSGPEKTGGPDPKAKPADTPTPPGQVLVGEQKAIEIVKLDILGGSDLKAGTDFYRETGKDEQITLAGVEALVKARQAAAKSGVSVAIEYRLTRFSKDDSAFQGTTTLLRWASEKGLNIRPAEGQ